MLLNQRAVENKNLVLETARKELTELVSRWTVHEGIDAAIEVKSSDEGLVKPAN